MKITLDIAEDVLQAAKERARRDKKSTGHVISELARAALTWSALPDSIESTQKRFGFRPFPRRGAIVTNELIDKLRGDKVL